MFRPFSFFAVVLLAGPALAQSSRSNDNEWRAAHNQCIRISTMYPGARTPADVLQILHRDPRTLGAQWEPGFEYTEDGKEAAIDLPTGFFLFIKGEAACELAIPIMKERDTKTG